MIMGFIDMANQASQDSHEVKYSKQTPFLITNVCVGILFGQTMNIYWAGNEHKLLQQKL